MSDLHNYNDFIKQLKATQPKTVDGVNNTSFFYYFNKIYKLLASRFIIEDYPEEWDIPYFKETLILNGVVLVTKTSLGVIPLKCGYYGVNVYNHPTNWNYANPVLGNKDGVINKDGVLIFAEQFKNTYVSFTELITRYAELLAQIDGSINTTLINSRVAQIFSANSNAQMKTMMKVYDEVSKGKPAVFIRSNPDEEFKHGVFNNVKNTYIGTELLNDKRTIINELLTELGINNSNTNKRERLITDEVNSNNEELQANIAEWVYNINDGFDKVNKMYSLNIKFKWNTEKPNTRDLLDEPQESGDLQE